MRAGDHDDRDKEAMMAMHQSLLCPVTDVLEQDFDDSHLELTAMRHEIETRGAVELHPNDGRIFYDPVPLCGNSRPELGPPLPQWRLRTRPLALSSLLPPPTQIEGLSDAVCHELFASPLARGFARQVGHVLMVCLPDADAVPRDAWTETWRDSDYVVFVRRS